MSSWDTLEQDALEDTVSSTDPQCKFGVFLNSLDSTNRSYVESALNNNKISGRALWRALYSRGMDCGYTVFRTHRVENCACFKDYRDRI